MVTYHFIIIVVDTRLCQYNCCTWPVNVPYLKNFLNVLSVFDAPGFDPVMNAIDHVIQEAVPSHPSFWPKVAYIEMATDALRSQVATKWQDSFTRLNFGEPGISGLMTFSQVRQVRISTASVHRIF